MVERERRGEAKNKGRTKKARKRKTFRQRSRLRKGMMECFLAYDVESLYRIMVK